MSALVSLRNWLTSFYQSALTGYGSGIAAGFSAWVAVRGGDGDQSDVATWFGNSDLAATGWRFTRNADIAASTPQTRLVALQAQVFNATPGNNVTIARVPIGLWVGRVYLLGLTYTGFAGFMNFYVNGARVNAQTATGAALVAGNSRLIYGIRHAAGDSRDELLGAAYSSYEGANLAANDLLHAAIFNQFKKQSGGQVMFNALTEGAAVTGQTVPIEACYDSYKNRGPFLVTPTLLANEGTDVTAGDLTFSGAAVLQPQVDTSPDYSGATLIP